MNHNQEKEAGLRSTAATSSTGYRKQRYFNNRVEIKKRRYILKHPPPSLRNILLRNILLGPKQQEAQALSDNNRELLKPGCEPILNPGTKLFKKE